MLLKEMIYMQRSFWGTETIPKAMLIANKDWKFSPRKWKSSLAFLIMHGNDFQLQEKIDFQVHITKRQCIAMLNYHKRYALLLKYTWPPQPLKWYGKCLPREALHRLEMSISGNRPTFTWKDIDFNSETPFSKSSKRNLGLLSHLAWWSFSSGVGCNTWAAWVEVKNSEGKVNDQYDNLIKMYNYMKKWLTAIL